MNLLILFAALQVADGISTLVFLKKGIREANPLLAYLFAQIDPLAVLIVFKVSVVAIAYALMGVPYWKETLTIVCVIYAIVVVQNIRLIRGAK